MKHLLIACAALFIGLLCPQQSAAQLRLGGKKLNTGKLLNAGADVVKAATLTDRSEERRVGKEC